MEDQRYTDDEIEAAMEADEQDQQASEGRSPAPRSKLHNRIDRLGEVDLEDIGEQAVAMAEQRIRGRRVREGPKEKVVFTGYYAKGTTKFFAFRRPSSELLVFRVKGGPHPLLSWTLSPYERRELALAMLKMLGFKATKRKDRPGWRAYLPSR